MGARLGTALFALGGAAVACQGDGDEGVGGGVVTTTTTLTTTTTTTTTTTPSGTGGSGGAPFVCDPPAAPGSLYALDAEPYDLGAPGPVSMCQFRGDVMLVVNTAAL